MENSIAYRKRNIRLVVQILLLIAFIAAAVIARAENPVAGPASQKVKSNYSLLI